MRYAKYKPTGKIIEGKFATKGKDCNCVCPECGQEVRVRKGDKRVFHFYHLIQRECQGFGMTAIHKLAQEIIETHSALVISEKEVIKYTEPKLEEPFLDKRPDVTVLSGGKEIFIEIFVTSDKKKDDRIFYQENKRRCIEIDLSYLPYDAPHNDVLNAVLSKTDNKEDIGWIEPMPMEKTSFDKIVDWIYHNPLYTIVLFIVLVFIFDKPRNYALRR